MRKIIIILLLLFLESVVFSTTYISETNFINSEFVEVYWDEILPKQIIIYDENEQTKNNTATLIKNQTNSKLLLIVGQNFLDENNIDSLNCSIFVTDKSQVSNGGLKNSGEKFQLKFENNITLKYNKEIVYNLLENETLHYSKQNNLYFLEKSSACIFDEINLSQISSNNLTQKNSSCDYQFEIKTKQIFFEDRLEYYFLTNAINYTIEYWIESFNHELVKKKRETKNTNSKYYTPEKKTQLFLIKSKMSVSNCTLNSFKEVGFYYEENKGQKEKKKNSDIKILNKNTVQNEAKVLELEVYRGDTQKRRIYVYLNSNKISSYEIEKFSTIKIKMPLIFKEGKNLIFIKGLDLEKELIIFVDNKTNHLLQKKEKKILIKKEKQFFEIQILNISKEKININLKTNIKENEVLCYILNKKTKISKVINISIFKTINFSIDINSSFLKKKSLEFKEKKLIVNLKLICKYKPKNIKTRYSKSQEFNLTIEKKETQSLKNLIKTNQTTKSLIYNSSTLNLFTTPLDSKKSSFNIDKTKKKQEYTSQGQELKQKSFYFVFIGVVIIFVIMLFSSKI